MLTNTNYSILIYYIRVKDRFSIPDTITITLNNEYDSFLFVWQDFVSGLVSLFPHTDRRSR